MRESVARYSAAWGADPMLVQGAGGNVSWKEGDTLWVKASGTWLSDAQRQDIFVPADLAHLRQAVAGGDYAVKPQVKGESTLRPSIETLLHGLMPQPVVVHVHAVEALAHLVRRDAAQRIAQRLDAEDGWACVDYAKPGAPLAQAVAEVLQRSPDTRVVLLKNHGVVIGADSPEEADRLLNRICEQLEQPAAHQLPAGAAEPAAGSGAWQAVADPVVQLLARDAKLFSLLETGWALFPDHVVFLGPQAIRLDALDDLAALPAEISLAFVRGQGVYARAPFDAVKQAQLRCYADVLVRQDDGAALASLSGDQVAELLNWDAEKYRTQMNAGRMRAAGAA